ncbi:MAG: hypothetical protein LBF59_08510, partial [Prevotellaceae bacterium]|nr:hypothetical protein [Prevotellaceae bacterium]
MRYAKIYTAMALMGIMALNICKYQLPYIEYNLFRDYIAENLCVKRFEANNDCRGRCFLKKQIEMINESENSADNQTEKKQIAFETDDCIVDDISENKHISNDKIHPVFFIE